MNYWPINNDLKDYAGSSDLIPHDLNKVVFAQDRFNISNSALYLSNLQFYTVKPGVYFYGGGFFYSFNKNKKHNNIFLIVIILFIQRLQSLFG